MSKVLVVGVAGYIGSHMVKMLGRHGCAVTTLDDLSSGHRDAVLCGDFVQGDMGDRTVLDTGLSRGFDAVMHFASFIQVGEPARLVADSSLIREKLGWQPRYADLATIVAHAWAWETRKA